MHTLLDNKIECKQYWYMVDNENYTLEAQCIDTYLSMNIISAIRCILW